MLCLLSALSLYSWCVVFECGSISRFKGVFSAVRGCCVGLCGLRALRGLCGFCTRVELGGLKACCVFAPVFHLLPISFCLSFYLFAPAFVLSFFSLFCFALVVFLCPLALSLWLFGGGCCFLFPCGLHAKRKGAKVLSLASSLRVS